MSDNLTTISSLSENSEESQPNSSNRVEGFKEFNNEPKPGFLSKIKTALTSKVFLIIALLVLIAGVGFFVYLQFFTSTDFTVKDPTKISQKQDKYKNTNKSLDSATSTEYPNPINGVYLTKDKYEDVTHRKPVAIMLNNHVDARPQAGISQADIIYEIVAEGGISRIMPVFHSQIPDRAGSVRSARIYFMQIAAEYWPIFSHWGIAHRPAYELGLSDEEFASLLAQGAAETDPRADARSYLDEIALPVANTDTAPNMFYREEGIDAAIEHTGYAKFKDVYEEFKKYYPEPSWSEFQEFDTWNFKDEKTEPTTPVSKISYNFWDFYGFDTVWDYDAETNTYKRTQGGVVTIDRNNEEEVRPVTVVVQYAKETKLNDVKGHLLYDVIGSGNATIYQDGGKINAKWSKGGARDRTKFTDLSGNPIEFNRGLIWVVVLPDYDTVTEE